MASSRQARRSPACFVSPPTTLQGCVCERTLSFTVRVCKSLFAHKRTPQTRCAISATQIAALGLRGTSCAADRTSQSQRYQPSAGAIAPDRPTFRYSCRRLACMYASTPVGMHAQRSGRGRPVGTCGAGAWRGVASSRPTNPLWYNGSPVANPNPGRLWSGRRRGGEIGVQPWQGSRFSILPPSLSPTLRAHR